MQATDNPHWPFPPGRKAVVGVVHLPPLPGAADYQGPFQPVLRRAVEDALVLARGGADGVIVENYGDAPFFARHVGPETVAAMSVVAAAVKRETGLVLGVNVLRNDAQAALAVAVAAQAQFVRINVLIGARLTDQGIVEGTAAEVLRYRKLLGAEQVALWADVDVKHSAPLAPRPLEEEVEELVHRGGADCLIVTGSRTGATVDAGQLQQVSGQVSVPVLAGSGVRAELLPEVLPWVQGVIVGTALHRQGRLSEPLDPAAVERLVQAVRQWEAQHG